MEYLHAIWKGGLAGLTLSLMIGAAFFTLIQTSIHRGFKAAMYVALGIFLSDSFVVFITTLGAASVMKGELMQVIVGGIGSLVLIAMGIYTCSHKVKEVQPNDGIELNKPFFAGYIIKGFVLNITNPAIWLLWVFWVGVVSANYTTKNGLNLGLEYTFFAAMLLFVFASDLLKCYIADKIRNFLTVRILHIVNIIFGVILIGLGVFLFINTLNDIFHFITVPSEIIP